MVDKVLVFGFLGRQGTEVFWFFGLSRLSTRVKENLRVVGSRLIEDRQFSVIRLCRVSSKKKFVFGSLVFKRRIGQNKAIFLFLACKISLRYMHVNCLLYAREKGID